VKEGAKTGSIYPWVVVGLLWPVAMLNYLDRQMIATVRSSIRADIPTIANDQDFGMLMAVFMWVYALLSPLGGYIADRFNRRWTVIGSLFVWSAVTWLTGRARTYDEMLCCRACMGISEAFYIPAALALIVGFHPGPSMGRAVGLHQSGIYAGLALGGIGGYVADHGSWRDCFSWFGAFGVAYAVLLVFALRDEAREYNAALIKPEPDSLPATFRALGSKLSFWLLVIYFTLPAIAGWATKNWLPSYLADTFNLKQGPAGLSATGYIHFASFLGVLLGGVVADRWMRRTARGYIYTGALGVLLLAPALLGLGFAWSLGSAVGFMVVFGVGWGFFDCNNMPILSQIVRPEHRATGYGLMNLVSISVGAAATVALGWIRDHHLNFSHMFALIAVLAIIGAMAILPLKPKPDPVG
jgi:MFS family permease